MHCSSWATPAGFYRVICWCPPHNKVILFPIHAMLLLNTHTHVHTHKHTSFSLSWMPFLYSVWRLCHFYHNSSCVWCVHLIVQSCLTLCDPMDCSTPGFPVLHYLRVCSNICPFSLGGYPTISSSVAPFWRRLPFPPPENLPDQGIEDPRSPALVGGFFTTESLGSPAVQLTTSHCDFQFFDWQE